MANTRAASNASTRGYVKEVATSKLTQRVEELAATIETLKAEIEQLKSNN